MIQNIMSFLIIFGGASRGLDVPVGQREVARLKTCRQRRAKIRCSLQAVHTADTDALTTFHVRPPAKASRRTSCIPPRTTSC
jgi:hypothetical protein